MMSTVLVLGQTLPQFSAQLVQDLTTHRERPLAGHFSIATEPRLGTGLLFENSFIFCRSHLADVILPHRKLFNAIIFDENACKSDKALKKMWDETHYSEHLAIANWNMIQFNRLNGTRSEHVAPRLVDILHKTNN